MRLAALLCLLLLAGPALAQQAFTQLEGSVDWPEDTPLPRGAVIEIVLEDIGRGEGGALEIASQIILPDPRPARFVLTVDPRLAPPRGAYRIVARMLSGPAVMFEGAIERRLDPVLDLSAAAITLDNAALEPRDPEAPVGRSWRLAELPGVEIPGFSVAKIELLTNGTARGNTGCNGFQARVDITAETIAIAPLQMTRRGCMPALIDLERKVIRALRRARLWAVEGPQLTLFDASGLTLARFRDDF